MPASAPYDFSIVIEWENILLAEDDRCHRMLRALSGQLAPTEHRVEVLVLFNPEQVTRTNIDSVLERHFTTSPGATLTVLEAPDQHYYELKNHGAKVARGEVLIFLDTDVLIEEAWFASITSPFLERPDINVVAGNTYLAHDTFVEKALALGWFFPLRNPENVLRDDGTYFFANNVAFRRAYFLSLQFPNMAEGMTRGACEALSRNILASGNRIYTQTAARAEHPPPSGARHMMCRALAHGRDDVFRLQAKREKSGAILKHGLREFVHKMAGATGRIRRESQRVNLPHWQKPFATIAIACFYLTALAGNCLTQLFPNYARAHWRI